MEDWLEPFKQKPILPCRYGTISATLTVPESMQPMSAFAEREALAEKAVRFFGKSGLEVQASAMPHRPLLAVGSRCEPSRHPLFGHLLQAWVRASGCGIAHSEVIRWTNIKDDANGYRDAFTREERYRDLFCRTAARLGIRTSACEGEAWAQSLGGNPAGIALLGEVFDRVTREGHLTTFTRLGFTLGRQGTVAPYGLPAVLIRLASPCKAVAERLGLYLLEGSPRIPCLWQIEPGVLLFENTPPVDGIWDESRFWQAWRALPPAAWSSVDAWAAVRVLRRVDSSDGRHSFYDHEYLPHQMGASLDDLKPPTGFRQDLSVPGVVEWLDSRVCEIALALDLDGDSDFDLRRHLYGLLATPHPFLAPLGALERPIRAIEDFTGRCAAVLHEGLLEEKRQAACPNTVPSEHTNRRVAAALEALASLFQPTDRPDRGDTRPYTGVIQGRERTTPAACPRC